MPSLLHTYEGPRTAKSREAENRMATARDREDGVQVFDDDDDDLGVIWGWSQRECTYATELYT